jgi:hypothetical protein
MRVCQVQYRRVTALEVAMTTRLDAIERRLGVQEECMSAMLGLIVRAGRTAWMTTMADSTQLALQEQIARIDRAIAETAKYATKGFSQLRAPRSRILPPERPTRSEDDRRFEPLPPRGEPILTSHL